MSTITTRQDATLFNALAAVPAAEREFALAFSIVTDRLGRLSAADRGDVLTLFQAWYATDGPADREEIHRAIREIVANEPVTATRLDTPPPLEGRRKAWATHVGKEIRRHREAAGLTQTQLAERSGLPQSHISRLENAEHSATRMTLEKLAAALEVGIGQLDPTVEE